MTPNQELLLQQTHDTAIEMAVKVEFLTEKAEEQARRIDEIEDNLTDISSRLPNDSGIMKWINENPTKAILILLMFLPSLSAGISAFATTAQQTVKQEVVRELVP